MKRVLLINTNLERHPYPVPPVGLCLLAAGLEGRFQVSLFDGAFQSPRALVERLSAFLPHYIGVSIRNIDDVVMERQVCYLDGILEKFITPVRAGAPATTIMGGPGFSLFPQALLRRSGFDYGVVGPGEVAFPALLEALESGEDAERIPGVVRRGGIAGMQAPVEPEEIASPLELPASRIQRFIDYQPYHQRGAYPIVTKRGCTHRCVYCPYPAIEGRRYRLRDAGEVADEIAAVAQTLHPPLVEFVDSTFNDPPGHAEAICAAIIDRQIQVGLRTMGINPAQVSAHLLELMKRAGFRQIDCTPDSASPQMLRRLGKNFSLAQLRRAARQIRLADIPAMWFFLLGGPGETARTIEESFSFIDEFINPLDMVHLTSGLRIYPGTPLQRIAVTQGVVSADDSLLEPRYYVSPELGEAHLNELLRRAVSTRPNCVRAAESTPDEALLRAAVKRRAERGTDEPMFRTLLALRREKMNAPLPK